MTIAPPPPRPLFTPTYWRLFVPKLYTVLRDGYGLPEARRDFIAGLTVAIVALPLSFALAIASGVAPERGLYTAIVAGFVISALGGSRFQIGGPTGAFVVVVFNVIQAHGYEGLAIATLMAAFMLIVAGFAKLGTVIKYVPYPVVTGFTAGIAVIIFTSQVGELLGIPLAAPPAEVIGKWRAYFENLAQANTAAMALGLSSIALIFGLRRVRPQWPAFLIVVVLGGGAVAFAGLSVTTIASRFGELPHALPAPIWPQDVTWARLQILFPSALTIAFLAGIESLLSAIVADGMTGRRHRSNCELVAQGLANAASALFGGIPATGAIARTATNIRAGAHSPVSGMLHAAFIALFMLAFAQVIGFVPLASLAAILAVVAWNMAEVKTFRHLMNAPMGDRIVLILTFALTILVDLTVAIEVGVVTAAFLFMHRMAAAVEIQTDAKLIAEDVDDFSETGRTVYDHGEGVPEGVEIYRMDGPFFFGAAAHLSDVLDSMRESPRFVILRMGKVPLIDASGVAALSRFISGCGRKGTKVVLSNVKPRVRRILDNLGVTAGASAVPVAKNLEKALIMTSPP